MQVDANTANPALTTEDPVEGAEIMDPAMEPRNALAQLKDASLAAPGDGSLRLRLAEHLLEIGELDEAEKTFREAWGTTASLSRMYRGLGRIFKHRGAGVDKIACLSAAVCLAPDDVWLRLEFANELRDIGQASPSAAQCEELVRRHPNCGSGYSALGKARRLLGEDGPALKAFRMAVEVEPRAPWLGMALANHLEHCSLVAEAEAAYRAIFDANPEFSHAHFCLAKMLEKTSRREEALKHFRAAAELEPDNAWYRFEYPRCLKDLHRFDEAIVELRRLTNTHATFYHGFAVLASCLRDIGEFEESLAAYQTAASFEERGPWLVMEYSALLKRRGRSEEAAIVLEELLCKSSDFNPARQNLGEIYCEASAFEKADKCFRGALEQKNSNVALLRNIITILCRFNRLQDADAICREFIFRNPQSAGGLLALAELARRAESRAVVSGLIADAARLEPDNIEAQLALAADFVANGHLDLAKDSYEKILIGAPQNIGALLGSAQVARVLGRRDDALALLRKAAEFAPQNEWAAVEISRELAEAGRFEEAKRALYSFDASFAGRMRAGHNARLEGQFAEARACFLDVVQSFPSRGEGFFELATEEIRAGRLEKALLLIKDAYRFEPGNSHALIKLGEIAQWNGDDPLAEKFFVRACEINAKNHWGQLALASCRASRGEIGAAMAACDAVDVEIGVLPDTQLTKVSIQLQYGDFHAAEHTIAAALKTFPLSFDIWLKNLLFQIKMGRFEVAEASLAAAPAAGAIERGRIEAARGELALTRWDVNAAAIRLDQAKSSGANDVRTSSLAAVAALLALDVPAVERHLHDCVERNIAERTGRRNANIIQSHIGQLLDEARLEGEAFSRLAAAITMLDFGAIASVVRDYPDYTTAAISFLVALRQKGDFLSASKFAGPDQEFLIPRTIVQFWDRDEPPPDISKMNDEWRTLNPDFEYLRFSSRSAFAFLVEMGDTVAARALARCEHPAQQADLFRLAFLFHKGGFYVDADDRCLSPLAAASLKGLELVCYQEEYGSVGNNFVGVVKGHPAIEAAFRGAVEAIIRGDRDIIWLSTGPGLLTRALAGFLVRESSHYEEGLRKLLILERHELYQFAAPHCASAYKNSPSHWNKKSFMTKRNVQLLRDSYLEIFDRPA